MKKLFAIIAIASLWTLSSCKDETILINQNSNEMNVQTELKEGMQRVVTGQSQLKQLLESGANLSSLRTRASEVDLQFSENEVLFVSLYDAQKEKVLSSLTPEQLSEVMSDPEELEFEPQDSIIADMRFAQVLNAEREIEVDGFVYKYTTKGVARVPAQYASELKNVEVETFNMNFSESQLGTEFALSEHMSFIPMNYGVTFCSVGDGDDTEDNDQEQDPPGGPDEYGYGDGGYGGGNGNGNEVPAGEFADSREEGLYVYDNTFVPKKDLFEVTFKDGDHLPGYGVWLHRVFTGFFGQNVVARRKLDEHDKKLKNRQINLNLYDQEYVIYSNIGTKLKFQKKVCGIWWNVKADEMIHGWEGIDVKFDFDQPIMPEFKSPFSSTAYHEYVEADHPINKQSGILFTVFNFDFKTKYLWTVLKKTLEECKKRFGDKYSKEAYDYRNSPKGLFALEQASVDHLWGPWSERTYGTKSVETKFMSKWFSGTCKVGFDLNGKISLKSIYISKDDHTALKAARVYGLIKYQGVWYGCRITKERTD